jgi:hypothetical protein
VERGKAEEEEISRHVRTKGPGTRHGDREGDREQTHIRAEERDYDGCYDDARVRRPRDSIIGIVLSKSSFGS